MPVKYFLKLLRLQALISVYEDTCGYTRVFEKGEGMTLEHTACPKAQATEVFVKEQSGH